MGSLGHGGGHGGTNALVEGLGDDIVLGELVVADQGGHFHLLVDVAGADIEGAAEDAGECQHVVDLVGEVAAAGGHHAGTACLGVIGEDLGGGVGAGEDDGVLCHGLHHLRGDGTGSAHTDENVGAHQHVGQTAGLLLQVGHLGHLLLDPVEVLTACVDSALAVAHGDVPESGGEQQLHDGYGSGACAGGDHLHVFFLLANHLQGVGEAGQGDHGGAVLVVVEDGNVALLLQLALDLEAAGRGDILQIHAAKAAGDVIDGLHELVHVLGLDAQGEGVHIGKGLEQHALALHDGHTGLGADVTQTQNGAAVGDNGAQVVTAGQLITLVDILLDLQAGLGHAGGCKPGKDPPCFRRGQWQSLRSCPSTRRGVAGILLRNP